MNDYVLKWLKKAYEDYLTAFHEFNLPPESEIITSSVCFHCQQAVEKFLKAYLTSKGVEFGKTHSLEFLKELCIREDNSFEKIDVGDLTFYAVEVRYPDDFYVPSLKETKEALEITEKVKRFVLTMLNISEKDLKK